MRLPYRAIAFIALTWRGVPAEAQVSVGSSAIILGTVARPGVEGRTLAEGYVTQPVLMARGNARSLRLTGDLMLDFERLTLERGELNAGMSGEGYVDRRHPHTLLHEAIVTYGTPHASLSAGKGFVPFGTDDPMSRPFVKYPVNHHLAQVLERALASAAIAKGPFAAEAAVFNGDEPESPTDFPNWNRFADSWAGRVTGRVDQYEMQASYAKVASPEQPRGGGLNAQKLSTSLRFARPGTYALVEWARSREYDHGRTAFVLYSLLGEGTLTRANVTLGLRAERTSRAEEERSANLFRTPRPHSDLSILGRTRWTGVTGNVTASFLDGRVRPFVEIVAQRPKSVESPSVFDPRTFYGATTLWSFSAGVRLGVGMLHERMGRYGAAVYHSMDHDVMDMEM